MAFKLAGKPEVIQKRTCAKLREALWLRPSSGATRYVLRAQSSRILFIPIPRFRGLEEFLGDFGLVGMTGSPEQGALRFSTIQVKYRSNLHFGLDRKNRGHQNAA